MGINIYRAVAPSPTNTLPPNSAPLRSAPGGRYLSLRYAPLRGGRYLNPVERGPVPAGNQNRGGLDIPLVLGIISVLFVGRPLDKRNATEVDEQVGDKGRGKGSGDGSQRRDGCDAWGAEAVHACPKHDLAQVVWMAGDLPQAGVDKLLGVLLLEGRLLRVCGCLDGQAGQGQHSACNPDGRKRGCCRSSPRHAGQDEDRRERGEDPHALDGPVDKEPRWVVPHPVKPRVLPIGRDP